LSGVDLTPLPAAPPELKPDANAVYFRINTDSPIWRELVENRDLVALHVDTRIPNPTVRFFAIR
jgi:type VI secretion system protein ImpJ